MGRGLPGFFDTVLGLLGVHLAPWMAPAFVATILLLLIPRLRRNVRTEQARKALREAGRLHGPAREHREQDALALVDGDTWGLVSLADVAWAEGRRSVVLGVLERLRRIPGARLQALTLERRVYADLPATAEQARLRAELLHGQGLHVAAEDLLARARERWPASGDLAVTMEPAPAPLVTEDLGPLSNR